MQRFDQSNNCRQLFRFFTFVIGFFRRFRLTQTQTALEQYYNQYETNYRNNGHQMCTITHHIADSVELNALQVGYNRCDQFVAWIGKKKINAFIRWQLSSKCDTICCEMIRLCISTYNGEAGCLIDSVFALRYVDWANVTNDFTVCFWKSSKR